MYYRIGDKIKILDNPRRNKSDIWVGMTGRIAFMMKPRDRRDYGIWGYGIELDEPDSNGNTKVILATRRIHKEHRRLVKLDSSKLHPKFLDYRSFKFSQIWK